MPSLVLYGSNIPDSTLVAACDMAAASGGVETSATTTTTGTNNFVEVFSQNGSSTGFSALQAPSGKGWAFKPGAGTFALGNWSASIALSLALSPGTGSLYILRFYKYSGGIYSAIGTINSGTISASGRTAASFPATSMPATTFTATDILYIDLYWEEVSGTIGGDNPTVFVSTSSTAGVVGDMQVTTSTFTPLAADASTS